MNIADIESIENGSARGWDWPVRMNTSIRIFLVASSLGHALSQGWNSTRFASFPLFFSVPPLGARCLASIGGAQHPTGARTNTERVPQAACSDGVVAARSAVSKPPDSTGIRDIVTERSVVRYHLGATFLQKF